VSGTASATSEAQPDTEKPIGKRKEDRKERLSGLSGGFEGGDEASITCIHELEPDACKVCNGYVRRLIESQKGGAS
jgi:hypothetical protein